MPGPAPKDPKTRQRRNKASTRANLRQEPKPAKRPDLPHRKDQAWHTLTVQWWEDLWQSPMADKFLIADKHRLFMLAELVDAFWYQPTKELAAEIRQQAACFGLTPLDRRRLEWNIRDDKDEDQIVEPPVRGAGRPIRQKSGAADVRRLLQVIK